MFVKLEGTRDFKVGDAVVMVSRPEIPATLIGPNFITKVTPKYYYVSVPHYAPWQIARHNQGSWRLASLAECEQQLADYAAGWREALPNEDENKLDRRTLCYGEGGL